MGDEQKDNILKIILLGETFVGKTSLINVFFKNQFDENIGNTLGSSFIQKTIETNNGNYTLKIWDTAGQERFRCLNKIFIKNSNIAIFVYDITRKSTFKELSYWINYVNEYLGNNNVIYGIVGNKSDLYDKEKEVKQKYPDMEFDIVELKEGYDFAEKNDALFCQTSSKEGAPEFSLFIRKLVEKFILKKQFIKTKTFTIKEEEIGDENGDEKKKCCK